MSKAKIGDDDVECVTIPQNQVMANTAKEHQLDRRQHKAVSGRGFFMPW